VIQYFQRRPWNHDRRGVLDTPMEPVIGLAEGETRWRSMTVEFVARRQSFAASFFIAGLIGPAASSYPSHALVFPSSAGTVRTV
jgi:hypothetical protein